MENYDEHLQGFDFIVEGKQLKKPMVVGYR